MKLTWVNVSRRLSFVFGTTLQTGAGLRSVLRAHLPLCQQAHCPDADLVSSEKVWVIADVTIWRPPMGPFYKCLFFKINFLSVAS